MPNQLAHGGKVRRLSRIDGLQKDLLVLRTKNWRTLAEEEDGLGKGFLRKPRPTLGCRAAEERRKELFPYK
ncbi:hypothetical protein TNCV_3583811 [Trichonephila clavipes]|nr:hypothetical protein TNCV_3583811 [Trichonephila clavipes]